MRLGDNPLLTLVTAITVIVGGLNSFSVTLGLAPFWADVVVTVALLYTLAHWWITESRERAKPRPGIHPPDDGKRRVPIRTLLVCAVLVALLVWNAVPVGAHLVAPRWQICGAFKFSCDAAGCVRFYDSRKRAVSDGCVALQDASGYLSHAAPNWWTYRPRHVAAVCGDKTGRLTPLTDNFHSRACDPRLELP